MNAFNFLNKALVAYPMMVKTLYEYDKISNIIRMGLIEIEVESI